MTELVSRVQWLKHASFAYDGSVRVAFDPWGVSLDYPVDLVLVSHGHYDHCDPDTVARITKQEGMIVAAEACADQLTGNVHPMKPGEVFRVGAVTVTATWAYNLSKRYHPRGDGVGYLVAIDGGTLFHAGDTDDIPETHALKPDVALLPVGGTYTMDVDEAVRAANAIGALVSVPMHYGYIVGSPDDGSRFAAALGTRAQCLKPLIPFS